jgi:hypothetical protein
MTNIAVLGAAITLSMATTATIPSRNHAASAQKSAQAGQTCQETPNHRSKPRATTFGALGK